jgi:hypothetical protein
VSLSTKVREAKGSQNMNDKSLGRRVAHHEYLYQTQQKYQENQSRKIVEKHKD